MNKLNEFRLKLADLMEEYSVAETNDELRVKVESLVKMIKR